MAFRSIVFAGVFLLTLTACQRSATPAPEKPDQATNAVTAVATDGYAMKGGVMLVVEGGTETRMETDVELKDGGRVNVDGMVTLKDGTSLRLPEGMMITQDGALQMRAVAPGNPAQPTSVVSSASAVSVSVGSPASGAAYQPFTDSVLSDGKEKVLFFAASWCPECKKSDAFLQTLLPSSEYSRSVYKLDYDTAADLKATYGVIYQHTFVVVDGQGKKLFSIQGPTEQQLKELLK